jgi:hypothetical protein
MFLARLDRSDERGRQHGKRASTSKRERLTTRTGTQFAKRTSKGRFKEMDEVGRSQTADGRKRAKKSVKSDYGNQADQKRSSRKW